MDMIPFFSRLPLPHTTLFSQSPLKILNSKLSLYRPKQCPLTSTCSEVLLWNGVEPFCLRGQTASEKSYHSNCSPPVSLLASLIKPHYTEIKESVSQDIIQGSKLAFFRHLRNLMQIRQWERKLILFSLCSLEKVACDTWLGSNISETFPWFSSELFMQEAPSMQ